MVARVSLVCRLSVLFVIAALLTLSTPASGPTHAARSGHSWRWIAVVAAVVVLETGRGKIFARRRSGSV